MKYCIFTDVHWSTNTSIVRQRENTYSKRLELLINSMNWVNEVAVKENCDAMICAGDFCDRSDLKDEEISALRDIKWNNLTCYFLVGNHESSVNSLRFKSVDSLESDIHHIINKSYKIIDDFAEIHFVPYVTESDRKSLSSYINERTSNLKQIIVSHNDIAGIQYGGFLSKQGFSVDEISKECDLYLNGHIHNSEHITNKILNLGSFTGHNFTNDSSKYSYGLWILDTSDMSLKFYENPYSLNFYKIVVEKESDLTKLSSLKNNAVVSISCNEKFSEQLKNTLDKTNNILTYKIIYTRDENLVDGSSEELTIEKKDHLEQFKEFVIKELGNTAVVISELQEVCK